MLYLSEAEVKQLLTMDAAIPLVEAAFRKLALDEAVNAPRQRVQTDAVMLHVLPAAAKTLNALGFKAYTTGKFPAQFHVYLFDPKTGGLNAILEADYLGQVRTGAATAVATKKLARTNASTVGLFGTGKQARTQLEAVCKVRKIRQVRVFARDGARLKMFAQEMGELCGTEVIPVTTPELAAANCDIVITATSARDPILMGQWLSEGTHLNIIGSNYISKAEVDTETIRRANLLTIDSVDQGRLEAGDYSRAFQDGVKGWADVVNFSRVLVGRNPGRESDADITVFKSLGLGIEDIAVGAKVLELATAAGIGKELLV
jgi:ornithine cyclodeaminase/alanine dehydrogenase-like protein (mu-crystallin family)